MTLSIVIPVYCTEDTIDRCLQSVLTQKFSDWEAILVDDGSTDNSGALCDDWAKRDPRFRVLHKSNGGLSDARNAGISLAQGDYITFIDSDDFISEDTYHQLMDLLAVHPDIDILEYSYVAKFGSDHPSDVRLQDRFYASWQSYWLESKAYNHTYACNKFFRRTLLDGVRFPKGVVFEDAHTIPHLLNKAQLIATTPIGCYYYCDNPNGITNRATAAEWRMLLDAHLKILRMLDMTDGAMEDTYYLQVVNIQLYHYRLSGESPLLPFRKIRAPWRLHGLKAVLKSVCLNIFGINNICKLYKTGCLLLRFL